MDDKEIVALYLDRDERAVEETMQRYGGRLTRLAEHFLKDKRDAEECVSDTYVKAWNSIPPNRPDDLFAYLAKLCRCTAFNIVEREQAQKRSAQTVELTDELAECLPDRSADSGEDDLSERLNEFLATLGKDKRAVFVGRYLFGDSIAEIAEKTGFSESKVKTTLHRTRESLRKYLGRKGGTL